MLLLRFTSHVWYITILIIYFPLSHYLNAVPGASHFFRRLSRLIFYEYAIRSVISYCITVHKSAMKFFPIPDAGSRVHIATFLAILFHTAGLAGMIFGNTVLFTRLTSMNMMVMFLLLLWTQSSPNRSFYLFTGIVVIIGFVSEYIGVHTGWLFGEYNYGAVLGISYDGIPLIIGVNWFIVIYCCGITVVSVISRMAKNVPGDQQPLYARWSRASVIVDGALLATFFDWVMEPVAVQLGYWQWAPPAVVPVFNYLSWFIVSVVLLFLFSVCSFNKSNRFAVHLLLIQIMFFLLLRTFLP